MDKAGPTGGPVKRLQGAVKTAKSLKYIHVFAAVSSFLLFAAAPGLIRAEEAPRPVKAELVSDVSAVKPGSSFELGVLFEVEPGWHVYWKNPGDSGLPTTVEWSVPEGFKTGEVIWPIPHVLKGAGGVVDYGYEDSLLLAVRVTAPEEVSTGTEAELGAKASWVSCKEVCIPGRAELSLSLPVSDDVGNANSDLFAEWSGRAPSVAASNGSNHDVEVKLTEEENGKSRAVILLDAGDDTSDVELYPGPSDSLVIDNISVERGEGGAKTSITFDIKRLTGSKQPEPELETLVVLTDGGGKRSGIVVPVVLQATE